MSFFLASSELSAEPILIRMQFLLKTLLAQEKKDEPGKMEDDLTGTGVQLEQAATRFFVNSDK